MNDEDMGYPLTAAAAERDRLRAEIEYWIECLEVERGDDELMEESVEAMMIEALAQGEEAQS